MMDAVPLLWSGAALAAAGVAVLRRAWSLPQRSHAWNGAGWAILLLGVVLGGAAEGAWGVSVVLLVAMGMAAIILAVAGLRSPQGRAAASNRRVGMLPEAGEPKRIGRRIGTFLLVILGGFVASLALALGIRGLGGALGWHDANSNAVALFAVPIGWAVIATVMLMQTRRRSQVMTLLVSSVPVVPVLVAGALR